VDNIGRSVNAQDPSLAGLWRSAISARSGGISLPRPVENPGFQMRKQAFESRFYRARESASGRLEKLTKNPIYSITCHEILCAMRNAAFMAQII
jgi:hypothetical protein